jgi:uroporphyrin-3 C-methyltransferase
MTKNKQALIKKNTHHGVFKPYYRHILWAIYAVFFIVLVALCAWNYHFYTDYQHLKANWFSFKNTYQKETNIIKQFKQEQFKQNKKMTIHLEEQIKKNHHVKNELLGIQKKIKGLSGRKKEDWLLAEIHYLIAIAEFKLIFQKDKSTTLALLNNADERLSVLAEPLLLPIRKAIAYDIAKIKAISSIDRAGIHLAIDALIKPIKNLKPTAYRLSSTDLIQNSSKLNKKTPLSEQNEMNGENSDSLLEENKPFNFLKKVYQQFLNDFIVIKDHSEPPTPLMTPKERHYLNQNLQLSLQKAQLALLQKEPLLFQKNLQQTSEWIQQFFVDNKATHLILKQLNILKAKKIMNDYPSFLASARAIKTLKENQLYEWLDTQEKTK